MEEIEQLIASGTLKVFNTAKNCFNTFKLIQRCTTIDEACTVLVDEFCRVGSSLCIDHRLFHKVMDRQDLMWILGIKDQRIYTTIGERKLVIINKSWKGNMPELVVDGITDEKRRERLTYKLAERGSQVQLWKNVDVNLKEYVERIKQDNQSTYGHLGSSIRIAL